jgi:hypothetical protein
MREQVPSITHLNDSNLHAREVSHSTFFFHTVPHYHLFLFLKPNITTTTIMPIKVEGWPFAQFVRDYAFDQGIPFSVADH